MYLVRQDQGERTVLWGDVEVSIAYFAVFAETQVSVRVVTALSAHVADQATTRLAQTADGHSR